MVKESLKGLPVQALEDRILRFGHPSFRARQLFRWIYQEREDHFDRMTDLSRQFRAELTQHFSLVSVKVLREQQSIDGTVKYLVGLEDGESVEAVFIPSDGRNTLCVSTQVGCKMGCLFCATGLMRFRRNLTSGEIVDQLLKVATPTPVSNLVLMGMGEPFDNYEEVIKALEIVQHPLGPQIGKRHITLSTVGIPSMIQDFLDRNLAKLAISLHATTNEKRQKIMPIARKYPLDELMMACRSARPKGRTRITFEYMLVQDFNDTNEDASDLVALVRSIPCKINLLLYNETPASGFKRPSEDRVTAFQEILFRAGLTVTYRRSRGRDIGGACGQLVGDASKQFLSRTQSSE